MSRISNVQNPLIQNISNVQNPLIQNISSVQNPLIQDISNVQNPLIQNISNFHFFSKIELNRYLAFSRSFTSLNFVVIPRISSWFYSHIFLWGIHLLICWSSRTTVLLFCCHSIALCPSQMTSVLVLCVIVGGLF